MTACIVGWSHLPFGKHQDASAESMVVEAARGRHRRRRAGARRDRRDLAGPLQRRLRRPGLHQLPGAPGRPGPALQARDPGRERLRHRLGRRASGRARDRGQGGADRARGGRGEDDASLPARPSARRCCAAPTSSEEKAIEGGFAGVFGQIAQSYFQRHGDQSDALAAIAAKNHQNGCANPWAQMRKDLGLRVLPRRLGEEPDRRRPAQAHRLLAGLRRRRRPGAGRRRDGAAA